MNKHFKNEYLFSEIYLEEITKFEEKPEVISSLTTLRDYREYAKEDNFESWKSSFIQKVLGVLAFSYNDKDASTLYLYNQGETENPLSVCYMLLPDQSLDNSTIGSHWSEKIIRHLNESNLKWGILTNGNLWRIYHTEEPTPYENYLEIDLQNVILEGDTHNYMIFYEFMKAGNFSLNEDGKSKFDQFKEDSYEKIEYIEEELKNALKQREEGGKGVLADLCMGYVEHLRSNGTKDFTSDELRKGIYSGAMLYMFRLLFLFYAAARDLLSEEEKKEFYAIIDNAKKVYSSNNGKKHSTELWEKLGEVFSIVDIHYNGGLFDPIENQFIENNRVSDFFLAQVIYNMNFYHDDFGNEQYISYRDMGVRHLGTLYEGLLEHKLFIAEENTQVKFDKKGIQFIAESDGGKIIEGQYIPKGMVYFGTDKGERKSTGSYYTPEYIVDYIVSNTVGEKLKELTAEFEKENNQLLTDINTAFDIEEKESLNNLLEDQLLNFVKEKILKLSILDPAMGSGHFLVNATNQVSNQITAFINSFNLQSTQISSTIFWRRRVVENCIYGVDLNPLAVELAKLSLWILSMAKDAHLSFLNHHLKCGNSLIGANLNDIGIYPKYISKNSKEKEKTFFEQDPKFKDNVEKVIHDFLAIEERETKTKDDIEFKKELLNEIDDILKPYKKVCDFHMSVNQNQNIDETKYFYLIKNQSQIQNYKNNYFHWDLEFPEIFNSLNGFDIIIGNPPYIQMQKDNGKLGDIYASLNYFTFSRSGDIYCLFYEKANILLKQKGLCSLITSNKWLRAKYATNLRTYLKKNTNPLKLIDFSDYKVFGTATVDTNILIFENYLKELNFYGLKVGQDFDKNKDLTEYFIKNKVRIKEISENNWVVLPKIEETIKSKVERIGEPLKNWAINIYFGIKTGYNKGFIIDSATRNQILSDEPESEKFIKPILRGKDINKYSVDYDNLWLLFIPWHFPMQDDPEIKGASAVAEQKFLKEYPNLYNYLDSHKTQLINRNKSETGIRYEWYALQRCAASYFEEFEKEKIIFSRIVKQPKFYFDKYNYYGEATTYILTGDENLKYLIAFLNCDAVYKIFYKFYSGGGIDGEIKIYKLEQLPIPKISIKETKVIEKLVDNIIHRKEKGIETKSVEKTIDVVIYKIYNFSFEEVLHLDQDFQNMFSKEKYEGLNLSDYLQNIDFNALLE